MTGTVSFTVFTDPAAMTQRTSGSIVGRLHVVVGVEALPTPTWNDFPVVVLAAWCQTLARRGRTAHLDFMDGPCALRLEVMPTGSTAIRFVDSGEERKLGFAALADIRGAIVAAATAVLDECARRAWSTPEMRQLARTCARLRNVLGEKRDEP